MNKRRVAFWGIGIVTVLTYGLFIPPILADVPPNDYYPNLCKAAALRSLPAGTPPDYGRDTDGDGLTDYDEDNKYRTDKAKADTDSDGLTDGDWAERREYTRTYVAVMDLRPPYSLADMNDFYQDARYIGNIAAGVDRIEAVLYPDAKELLCPAPYGPTKNEFTAPTFAKNYDSAMERRLLDVTSGARTDLQAVLSVQRFFNSFRYEDLRGDLGYSIDFPLQFQYYTDGSGGHAQNYGGLPSTYSMDELLARQFFAAGMFERKTHGACSSSATLRGALFRAAGLEERTVFTIPLFYSIKTDGTRVDVSSVPPGSFLDQESGRGTIADHFFNEVRIGGRWIRVDTNLIDPGVHGPWVKLMAMHDQADVSWAPWDSRRYFEERPYTYVSIEERPPTYRE